MANFFDLDGTQPQPDMAPINKNFFDLENMPKEEKKAIQKVGRVEDFFRSIPTGIKSGVAGLSAALQPAATAEAAMNEPSIQQTPSNPADTEGIIERTIPPTAYEPQNIGGQYGKRVGEFLPYLAVPGAGPELSAAKSVPAVVGAGAKYLGSRLANEALIPAAGAETGRQVTLNPSTGQPTSATPYAELLGGLLAPGVRSTMAGKPTAEHAKLTSYLLQHGIEPTAGDQAGVGFARWVEQNAPDMPLLGGLGQRINQARDTQFTQELMRRAGAKDMAPTTRAMPEEVNNLRKNLSENYDYLKKRNDLNYSAPGSTLIDDLNKTATTYTMNTGKEAPERLTSVLDRIIATRQEGKMSGTEYGHHREELADAANRAEKGGNSELAFAYTQTRNALDRAWGHSISPEDKDLWLKTNQQWGNLANLKASVSGPGQSIAEGLASPEKYRTAVERWEGKDRFPWLTDENSQLARASTVLNRLPQSGTGPRTTATILGSLLGAATLGHIAGGHTGSALASGAMLGPSMLGGLMLHAPGQALMKPLGQSTPGYLTPYIARALLNQQLNP